MLLWRRRRRHADRRRRRRQAQRRCGLRHRQLRLVGGRGHRRPDGQDRPRRRRGCRAMGSGIEGGTGSRPCRQAARRRVAANRLSAGVGSDTLNGKGGADVISTGSRIRHRPVHRRARPRPISIRSRLPDDDRPDPACQGRVQDAEERRDSRRAGDNPFRSQERPRPGRRPRRDHLQRDIRWTPARRRWQRRWRGRAGFAQLPTGLALSGHFTRRRRPDRVPNLPLS